jgi:ADP-glucose pyrophosphorylase
VRGGRVAHSVLSPLARVGAGARLVDSILMARATVSEGAELERVIEEEGVAVPPRERIEFERELTAGGSP